MTIRLCNCFPEERRHGGKHFANVTKLLQSCAKSSTYMSFVFALFIGVKNDMINEKKYDCPHNHFNYLFEYRQLEVTNGPLSRKRDDV